jgi:hypothetical protein
MHRPFQSIAKRGQCCQEAPIISGHPLPFVPLAGTQGDRQNAQE